MWHDTIRHLQPDLMLISVAGKWLEQIQFESLSDWTVVHTVTENHKKPLVVKARRVRLDPGHDAWIVFGPAGQKPFGLISNTHKAQVAASLLQVTVLASAQPPPGGNEAPEHDHGPHLPHATNLNGMAALIELLTEWAARSDAPTIGDVGAYGGAPWIRVKVGDQTSSLNADTKRSAVISLLDHHRSAGPLAWQVIANQSGKINKVVYRTDLPPKGFYCYLDQPRKHPGPL